MVITKGPWHRTMGRGNLLRINEHFVILRQICKQSVENIKPKYLSCPLSCDDSHKIMLKTFSTRKVIGSILYDLNSPC